MNKNQWKKLFYVSFALIILLTASLGFVLAQTPTTFSISGGVYPSADSYTLSREGSYYYAKTAYGSQPSWSGSTNGSLVILNSVNGLSSTGGTVFLTKGIYQIDTTLTFPNATIHFKGESYTGRENEVDGTVLSWTGSTDSYMFDFRNNEDRAKISDIQLYGNDVSNLTGMIWGGSGVPIQWAWELESVSFQHLTHAFNLGSDGAHLEEGVFRNIYIIAPNGIPILLDGYVNYFFDLSVGTGGTTYPIIETQNDSAEITAVFVGGSFGRCKEVIRIQNSTNDLHLSFFGTRFENSGDGFITDVSEFETYTLNLHLSGITHHTSNATNFLNFTNIDNVYLSIVGLSSEGGSLAITPRGAGTEVYDIIGLTPTLPINPNSGSNSGSSPFWVAHSLIGSPSVVTITARSGGLTYGVTDRNATHFQITHSGGGSETFDWKAEY